MSAFNRTRQLLSSNLKPNNSLRLLSEPPSLPLFQHHYHHPQQQQQQQRNQHHLSRRTPATSTVDRRRRVSSSVVSHPSKMAVGLFSPQPSQSAAADTRPQAKSDHFQGLVDTLKEALGPSSGLDSSDVDVKTLVKAMRAYDAKERGWVPYALADPGLGYTRNLVDEGNGKSNLLVLVWTPGKGSPIHDHGNAHCIMKILHGNLTESRYEFPNSDKEQPMELIRQTTFKENQVAYMADELGLHKMENKGDDYAISLHLYTPPNVAKSGCHTFNPITGERSYVPKCGYYSKFTQKL